MTAFNNRPADEKTTVGGYMHNDVVRVLNEAREDHPDLDVGTFLEAAILHTNGQFDQALADLREKAKASQRTDVDQNGDAGGGGNDSMDSGEHSGPDGVENSPDGPEDTGPGDTRRSEDSVGLLDRPLF